MKTYEQHKKELNEVDWVKYPRRKEYARDFVETDNIAYLIQVFTWNRSPQNVYYWKRLFDGHLTNLEEAREYVKWLLTPEVKDDGEE